MKVAQMMIKTVLTVIVTVIDPLFFFFFGPCSAISIAFSSFLHILCTCDGRDDWIRDVYFFFSVSLFFFQRQVVILAKQ